MRKNISTLIVLSPALTAVERVSCKRTQGDDDCCRAFDLGFEDYYKYFSMMMDLYQLPYIDSLENLVAYSKKNKINSLYGNNGKDIHHYSPQGNLLLARAIAKRISITKTREIALNNN
jgi:hypothetical protein